MNVKKFLTLTEELNCFSYDDRDFDCYPRLMSLSDAECLHTYLRLLSDEKLQFSSIASP